MLMHHMPLSCLTDAGPPGAMRARQWLVASLRRLAVAGALAAAPASAQAAPPQYHATVLPGVPGYGSVFPGGMNEDGDIVANAEETPEYISVLYSATGMTLLPRPPGSVYNVAQDLNETGLIVGQSDLLPFYWHGAGGNYLPNSLGYGHAKAVNAAGEVVGAVGLFSFYPVHWPSPASPSQTLQGIPGMPGTGYAFAINGAGQIAGSLDTPTGGRVAVRWNHGGAAPTVIGPLPAGMYSEAQAINSRGDLAGYSSGRAMFYDEAAGQLVEFGTPGSVARGINDARAVVGESYDRGQRAFLWLDGTMYDLTDLVASSNVQITFVQRALAINNAGQILVEVGAVSASGNRVARLTPLRAPAIPAVSAPGLAATALLLAGLACLLLRRRLPRIGGACEFPTRGCPRGRRRRRAGGSPSAP